MTKMLYSRSDLGLTAIQDHFLEVLDSWSLDIWPWSLSWGLVLTDDWLCEDVPVPVCRNGHMYATFYLIFLHLQSVVLLMSCWTFTDWMFSFSFYNVYINVLAVVVLVSVILVFVLELMI